MYSLRAKWFWIGVSIALIATITYLSLLPAKQLPSVAISDKILHFIAYFVLATWFVGFIKTRWYWLIGLVLLGFSYAIEELQGMSRWRQFEWYDVLANASGIVTALLIGFLLLKGWSQKVENRFLPSSR